MPYYHFVLQVIYKGPAFASAVNLQVQIIYIDTLDPGSKQIAVEEGRDGLAGLRDPRSSSSKPLLAFSLTDGLAMLVPTPCTALPSSLWQTVQ